MTDLQLTLGEGCCYATLPFLIAFSVTLAQAPYYGMGRHMWDLDAEMSSGMYFWILVSVSLRLLYQHPH